MSNTQTSHDSDDVKNRRSFLKTGARSLAGFMLMTSSPPWIRGSLTHTTAYRERSFFTMGSVATISVYGESTQQIDEAINRVIGEFQNADGLLSVFNPASCVSKLNGAAGREEFLMDPEVVQLFVLARKFSELTNGAFDVTVEPLMRTWGFRNKQKELLRIPSDRELTNLLSSVGYENIVIDMKSQLIGLRNPLAAVDLGGIAVGWTIDRAVAVLREYGVTAAFINHGGDAYALGIPEESDGWRVGIPDPDDPEETIHKMILHNEAIATSGNYQNFVRIGHRRFGHLLDARSGRPDSELLSMTVVAKTALEADAFSTGLFCLGMKEAAPVFCQHLMAFWVERQDRRPILREMMKKCK